jgi:hypothetical protein
MDFMFDCSKALDSTPLNTSEDNIVCLDSNKFQKLSHPMLSTQLTFKQKNMADIIDRMGEASSKVSCPLFTKCIIKIIYRLKDWVES